MANQFTNGYALLIAVDANRVPGWELPIAAKNVLGLAHALTEPHFCAYARDRVKVIAGEHATRLGILDGLDWLVERLRADGAGSTTALVYLSGHVWRDTATSSYHFIPYDARKDANPSFLPVAALTELLDDATPGHLFVAFDGHHLSPPRSSEERERVDAFRRSSPLAAGHGDGLTKPVQGGRVLLISSRDAQPSCVRKDGAMSIFTYHLIEALTGCVPSKANGTEVLASEVVEYVSRRVRETALSEFGRDQTPDFQIRGDFPVALRFGGTVLDGLGNVCTAPADASMRAGDSIPAVFDPLCDVDLQVPASSRGGEEGSPSVLYGGYGCGVDGGAHVRGTVKVAKGDVVGRDKIATGDIEGSGIAIGPGARATVNNVVDGKHVSIRTLNVYQGSATPPSSKAKRAGAKRRLIQEAIRLDVAAPREAVIEEPFEIAASVRQPNAPKLAVEDLEQVSSQDGAIFRGRQDETVSYRIEVVAGACDVVPSHYVLKLRPHENSRPVFFQVTARRAGRRSLVVNAYQEDENLAAATRLQVAIQLPVRSNS